MVVQQMDKLCNPAGVKKPQEREMTTKELIRNLRVAHPDMKAKHMASDLGVSRERVRQILNELGLPIHFPPIEYVCIDCGKPVSYKAKRCRACYISLYSKRTEFVCLQCSKAFSRRNSEVRASLKRSNKISFCSKRCQGTWLGQNYGLRSHKKGN